MFILNCAKKNNTPDEEIDLSKIATYNLHNEQESKERRYSGVIQRISFYSLRNVVHSDEACKIIGRSQY